LVLALHDTGRTADSVRYQSILQSQPLLHKQFSRAAAGRGLLKGAANAGRFADPKDS